MEPDPADPHEAEVVLNPATADTQPSRHIVILGGGFGGIYTALALERELRPEDQTDVTLISPDNFFLFTPMLCEVASSSIDTRHAINPIRRLLKRTQFVQGEAVHMDVVNQSVTVRDLGGRLRSYAYDHLVVALGANTGFFGMRDVEEHALTAKTIEDALALRNWVIEMLEMAETEPAAEARAALLTFVVAGGGLTGVEIAGELNELLRQAVKSYTMINERDVRVMLVEAGPRLLVQMDDRLSDFALRRLQAAGVEVHLQTRVTGATVDAVGLSQGESISTRTLVWATGVAPSSTVAASPLPTDDRGFIQVDAHLRVSGMQGVWALGDCAAIPDVLGPGKTHPATAQHAVREARQLGRNIVATIRGSPTLPFHYKTLGQMATLGHRNGIGVVGPFRVWGFVGWALWRAYYLWHLPRLDKRLRVAMDWSLDLIFPRDISQIQTHTAARMQKLGRQSANPTWSMSIVTEPREEKHSVGR
jgi:NADH dehydrogenase